MNKLIDFLSMAEPNVRYVVIGSVLLTASSAVIGCFAFLRKRSLAGDAIAHSILPGICLSFLLAGTKNPLLLLAGAFATGWISLYLVTYITSKSKIKEDSAIGIILSVFFAIGILILTIIQHSGNVNQAGLDSFLFGKAAAIMEEDLYVFGITAVILISTVFVFFKELTLLSFDRNYAQSIGQPIVLLEFLLSSMTVMAVVVGIQAVGVVLMAAMLITPAATARYWTNSLPLMIFLAGLFGSFSGLAGAYVSYISPAMPTGPWVVTIISVIAMLTFFLAPGKGILAKLIQQRENSRKILGENILKALFQLGETHQNHHRSWSREEIQEKRMMDPGQLAAGLKILKSEGYLKEKAGKYCFTKEGLLKGKRTTRLHRLWELYLVQYLKIAPDHVHDDAESIEHVITPEIESILAEQLGDPDVDPHEEKIPR
ncbi:MAG: iron chelate uptake ABC transporter family permease subunit [Cytophagaceae bacterium]